MHEEESVASIYTLVTFRSVNMKQQHSDQRYIKLILSTICNLRSCDKKIRMLRKTFIQQWNTSKHTLEPTINK